MRAAASATSPWKIAGAQRRRRAARAFKRLKDRPAALAQRRRQRLEHAGPGGRIGDEAEMQFFEQDELRVAGEPARQRVGQAERLGVGQDADAVGAAEAGGERRGRAAHHVHVRVARGHRPPGAFAMDPRRRGVEAAGRAHAAPHQAQGAKLGEGEELVGVGGEAEADRRRRRFAREAAVGERAQIGDRRRSREAELLRRRSAGGVDRARVGGEVRSGEALRGEE